MTLRAASIGIERTVVDVLASGEHGVEITGQQFTRGRFCDAGSAAACCSELQMLGSTPETEPGVARASISACCNAAVMTLACPFTNGIITFEVIAEQHRHAVAACRGRQMAAPCCRWFASTVFFRRAGTASAVRPIVESPSSCCQRYDCGPRAGGLLRTLLRAHCGRSRWTTTGGAAETSPGSVNSFTSGRSLLACAVSGSVCRSPSERCRTSQLEPRRRLMSSTRTARSSTPHSRP